MRKYIYLGTEKQDFFNNLLERFVQGQTVFGISKQDALGVDDLLNFLFRTEQAREFPHDPVRRFGNVVDVAGGYTPLDVGEAKGVLQAYTFFIVPNRQSIIDENPSALTLFMEQVVEPAKVSVIETFAQFPNAPLVDGEVLVGQDNVEGDTIDGTENNDLIFGEGGDDTVQGAGGADILYGGDDRDELQGGTENDFLFGESGEDFLDGGAGDDELDAGTENDVLVGGLDNDTLKGGGGFDIYINNVGDGQDTIDDSDGVGVLIYDNGALTGGVRQTGDPAGTFVSPDGRFQYVDYSPKILSETVDG